MEPWGYGEDNGPSVWSTWFPIADSGTRQSPVDILTDSCCGDVSLGDLKCEYEPSQVKLVNTGSTWRMDFSTEGTNLSGGPLGDSYKVVQMHAHWGDDEGKGSEHTLDGKMFDAELHIVHYNTKYSDPAEALDKPDGLAVLGVFIQTGKYNLEMENICQNLMHIETKNTTLKTPDIVNPTNLLPSDKEFFTYLGSLTTPPLFESVSWILFKESIEMSKDQLDTMRALKTGESSDCDCMVNNYRPPCQLGDRKITVVK